MARITDGKCEPRKGALQKQEEKSAHETAKEREKGSELLTANARKSTRIEKGNWTTDFTDDTDGEMNEEPAGAALQGRG